MRHITLSGLLKSNALLVLSIAACSDAAPRDTVLVESRDSADIRIVEADWEQIAAAIDTFALGSPTVRVGVTEGDPRYQFDRVATVVPLGSRGFAVADDGASNIRVFDDAGAFVSEFGREGDGPGEFRFIGEAFEFRGDSLVAYDPRSGLATVFGLDSEEPRSFRPRPSDPELGNVNVTGALPDGRLLVVQSRAARGTTELTRRSNTLLLFSPIGDQLAVLDSFPGSESYSYRTERFAVSLARPYALDTYVAAFPEGIIVGDAEAGGFARRDANGQLRLLWRSTGPRSPLTPEMQEGHRDSLLANNPMPPGMDQPWADGVRAIPYPDSVPHFGDMLTDESGTAWFLRVRPADGRPVWAVVDSEGQPVALLAVPNNLSIKRVTASQLYAVTTDELGVEYVEIHTVPWG